MRSNDANGKAKVGTEGSDKVSPTLDEDVSAGRFNEKEGDFGGKKVPLKK